MYLQLSASVSRLHRCHFASTVPTLTASLFFLCRDQILKTKKKKIGDRRSQGARRRERERESRVTDIGGFDRQRVKKGGS